MSKWISIKDRLPEEQGNYLIFIKCGVTIGWFDNKGRWRAGHFYLDNGYATHWMPLPQVPKEEET